MFITIKQNDGGPHSMNALCSHWYLFKGPGKQHFGRKKCFQKLKKLTVQIQTLAIVFVIVVSYVVVFVVVVFIVVVIVFIIVV